MPPTARQLRIASHGLVAAVLACAAVAAGCGGSDEPASGGTETSPVATTTGTAPPPTSAPATETAPQYARELTVYFSNGNADKLIEETRNVSGEGSDLRLALVELAKGPSGPDAVTALPPGTQIVGTDVRGGEALVNLSSQFVAGYPPGGAAAEFAVVAPIVYTATAVEGVERVRITVDGRTPAPTGSQYDWSSGFTRADFPDVAGTP
jgi:spore germination protein GerM